MAKHEFPQRAHSGFSMVELLVATAITLIGLLVITQVFSAYEGWRRTTTGAAQTQEGGLLGAFSIEQDLRHAGFGLVKLDCVGTEAGIKAYNVDAAQTVMLSETGMPVTITRDDPPAGSDKISVLYSTSPFANIPASIQQDMLNSSAVLTVDQRLGFSAGDMLVISQPDRPCAVVQVSGPAVAAGLPNVTGPGSSWNLPHVVTDTARWNPQGAAQNVFPVGGYVTGAMVLNLGQAVDRRYYVQNAMLRMDERNPANASWTTYDLIPGVVGLRARIVAGTNPQRAIQFGLIVRSGIRERSLVSPATIEYWPDENLALADEDRHYRYRVFQTIVPLKNIVWNP